MEEMMTDKRTSTATTAKTGTAKSNMPEPTEPPGWAWPDVAGAQMNSVKTLNDISRVFVHTAQELASQQTEFLKANVEAMQNAASAYREADPNVRLARQSDLYRDIMERSVDHVSTVAETVSGCCCEAMDHVAEAAASSVDKAPHHGSSEHASK
jgi:hypothetical protein